MESFIDILISYGYGGMFISAFVAGSVFPFSSEAVMIGLLAAGLNPTPLAISATIGNWAGSMLNYFIGRLGKMEWIERYLHVKKEKIARAQRFMGGRGAWMGIFTFMPVLGSAISIALGLMRANVVITSLSTFIGKAIRYVILLYSASLFL